MSQSWRPSRRGPRLVLAATTALMLMAAAACGGGADSGAEGSGGGSDDPVTLTVMRNPPELTPEQVKEFEAEHPNIKLTLLDSDPTKLKSLQAAGNAPDVFRVQGPEVPQLVTQRQLLDLTDRFESSDLLAPDDLAPANDLYEIDGKRYGAVKDWSPDYTVFINNALFEQAGVPVPAPDTSLSWAELADLGNRVKDGIPGFDGVGIVGQNDFGVNRTIQAMLAEGDTRLYSDDGTSIELTDSPDAMEALAYHVDLAKTGATWSPLNPDPSWGGDDFMKNKAAIAVYGYWFSGYMTTEPSSAVGENYTMLVGPHWDDEAARVNPTVTATGYVINRETEQEEAAWTFLEWFLGGKAAEDRAKTGYGVPAQESLYDLMPETTAVQKQVQAVLQQEMPRAERLDFNPYYDDAVFGTSYNANLEKHLRGEISMDELAANVEKDVNASIEEGVQRAKDAE